MIKEVEFEKVIYKLDDSIYKHSFGIGRIYTYCSDSDERIEYVKSKNSWIINNIYYLYDGKKFTECVKEKINEIDWNNVIPKEAKSAFARCLKNATFNGGIL